MSEFTQTSFGDDRALVPAEQEEQTELPAVFDYRLLSADNREFVMQKADETQILLKRTTEKIVEIGKNLIEVKERLPHGMFGLWLKSEFSMTQRTAGNFMRVAEKFAGKLETVSNLPATALYLLASPDTPQEAIDETIQRASAGEKITKALVQQIIDAQEAIKAAQEAEAKAKADLLTQEALFHQTEVDLKSQIDALRQEMTEMATPPVEIQIQKEEVIPDEVKLKLATWAQELENLQQEIKKLEAARDSEKARADGFAKRFMDELPERQRKEENERIRAQWHALATEFQATVKHLISEWPTVLESRVFEPDEWAEVDIIREAAVRVVGECDRFRHKGENIVVESNGHLSPFALTVVESEV